MIRHKKSQFLTLFMELFSYGAEANIFKLNSNWLVKKRDIQEYRHPKLDLKLRVRRTRREFKVINKLLEAGVNVAKVKDLDLNECSFKMEYINGQCIIEHMSLDVLKKSIVEIAKMHKEKIVHCDLTPLNIILKPSNEVFLIDFGLSEFSHNREERAVDLNVFFTFLQNDFPSLCLHKEELLTTYREEFNDNIIVDEIFTRLEQIEKRGRNKNKN